VHSRDIVTRLVTEKGALAFA